MDEILAGGCVAMLHKRFQFDTRYLYSSVVFSAVLWAGSASPFTGWLQYLRPYVTALLLAGVLCHKQTLLAAFLTSSPMRYLANISYALYIIHHATYQGWMNTGTTFERYALKRPISFIITFVLAHLSTRYFERPLMAAGKRWILHRRKRNLAPLLPVPARRDVG